MLWLVHQAVAEKRMGTLCVCHFCFFQILSKLKGLALDTEAELERQDAALDGITVAVDRATLTVDKHNRRMRKLL